MPAVKLHSLPTIRQRPFRRARRASRIYGAAKYWLLAAVCIFGLGWDLWRSPWPIEQTVLHWLASPNCDSARAVGLAPARRGEPGYYARHDADSDGIACEAWPRS